MAVAIAGDEAAKCTFGGGLERGGEVEKVTQGHHEVVWTKGQEDSPPATVVFGRLASCRKGWFLVHPTRLAVWSFLVQLFTAHLAVQTELKFDAGLRRYADRYVRGTTRCL